MKRHILRPHIGSYIAEVRKDSTQNSGKKFLQYIPSYFRWRKYLNAVENVLLNDMPWFNFEAIDFLDGLLNKHMRVFEYSSGGSTLFFSARVMQVVSVEHDETWYKQVLDIVNQKNIKNSEIKLVKPEDVGNYSERDHDKPDDYISSDARYHGQAFVHYAKSIDPYPDGYFDIVLIDGRARPSCVAHAQHKVKVGGYLILDNSERDEYRWIHESLAKDLWKKQSFYGPGPYVMNFWGTTYWNKLR
jgi:hypothetical protein